MRFRSEPSWMTRLAAALLFGFLIASFAPGQQGYPTPLLKKVIPPGGRIGSEVEITLDGVDLDEAKSLLFSTPGFKAIRLPDPTPDPKKKQPPPPPRFQVTVPTNAPLGSQDLRVVGKWGISNPRAFVVGKHPEVEEVEPNNDVPQAQKIDIGTTVNGVIGSNTDVDYVAFTGKKGQRVVIHCAATTVDSRLTAYLQLFTMAGRELALNRFYRDGDALISHPLPSDGDYYVRLSAFAYQGGGPESFYRLTISDGPWIDAVYPPVIPTGKPTLVTVFGRNLPGGVAVPGRELLEQTEVTITAPEVADGSIEFPGRLLPRVAGMRAFPYRLGNSNPALMVTSPGPVVLDNEANDTPEAAQEVPLPCDLCGRVEKRGDRDYYAFTASKGEVIVLEGYGDRLRSPLDLFFVLTQAEDGKVIGEYDTHPELPTTSRQFFTYTDDPLGRVVIPADGKYVLRVSTRDYRSRGGPREVYWVSIRREQPDFDLVVVGNHESGTGLTLRRGSHHDLQVVCFRHDGFEEEITLTAEGLPPGVTCEPQILGPKVRQGVLVLSATSDAKDWAGEFTVKGTATVAGKPVVRVAQGGCLVYPAQGNTPALSRLTRSVCLAVREPGPFRLTPAQSELSVPVGGSGQIKIKVEKQHPDFKDNVVVTLAAGPVQSNGNPINVGNVNIGPGKEGEVKLTIPTSSPPGNYNLVFRGTGKLTIEEPETKKKRNTQPVAVSRPIRLTVFDRACDLALVGGPVEVQPEGETALTVAIKRLHGFKGPVQLELVPPGGGTGLTAAPVTVPENASEAKLLLKAAKNAKPTRELMVVLRGTTKFGNLTLKTEERVPVAVDPKAVGPEVKATDLLPAEAPGWRYATGITGEAWLKPEFNDSAWKTIKAPFGNGETEITARKGTELSETGEMIWARRTFEIPPQLLGQKGVTFRLRVASDNSAIVYLNGKLADKDEEDHEFSYWNRAVVIPATLLRPGQNSVAVQVNNNAGSSDLYLDLAIQAEVPIEGKK